MKRLMMTIACLMGIFSIGLTAFPAMAAGGGIDSATVYFGMPDPGTDDPTEFQDHKLLPDNVVIKSFEGGGGIVSFIVSGSSRHKVGVYSVACGTRLQDIAAQVTDDANNDVFDSEGTLILQMNVVDTFGYIDSDPSSRRYYLGVNPQSPADQGDFVLTNF
jgi:hypothetical protein